MLTWLWGLAPIVTTGGSCLCINIPSPPSVRIRLREIAPSPLPVQTALGGGGGEACVLSVSVGLSLACLGHTTAGGHELSWHGGAPCSFTAPSSQLSKSSDSTGHGSPQACHLLMSTADEFSLSLLFILWNFLSFIPEAT